MAYLAFFVLYRDTQTWFLCITVFEQHFKCAWFTTKFKCAIIDCDSIFPVQFGWLSLNCFYRDTQNRSKMMQLTLTSEKMLASLPKLEYKIKCHCFMLKITFFQQLLYTGTHKWMFHYGLWETFANILGLLRN